MKIRILESPGEIVEPGWGGALAYEALNEIVATLIRRESVELEFSDGRRQRLVRLSNGWVGVETSAIDREAETRRVGQIASAE